MKKIFIISIPIISFLLISMMMYSCKSEISSDIITIEADYQNETIVKLSSIAENVKDVELEMTDKSLISKVKGILFDNDYIIAFEKSSIMLFSRTGKFINRIGSKGQGPGEFIYIMDVFADFRNKLIYVFSNSGIICYDFDGNIRQTNPMKNNNIQSLNGCLIHTDNNFILSHEYITTSKNNNILTTTNCLYYIDSNLSFTDSINIGAYDGSDISIFSENDILTENKNHVYFYPRCLSNNTLFIDTLYQVRDKHLVPDCQLNYVHLNISNNHKDISTISFYKSRRFYFANYNVLIDESSNYFLCYDTKENKSYNIRDGYTDDFFTNEKIKIRPLKNNSEMFYYLHTNMPEDNEDEPNPTLYIGTLKK